MAQIFVYYDKYTFCEGVDMRNVFAKDNLFFEFKKFANLIGFESQKDIFFQDHRRL